MKFTCQICSQERSETLINVRRLIKATHRKVIHDSAMKKQERPFSNKSQQQQQQLLYLHDYLRNRKHFPCFCRFIETRVEVWENEKCCGNTSRRRVFPQLFRVLPNLHECFYNSIETPRKCSLFLLENSPRKITKNEENLIVLFIIKT